jgi:adenosine deaminase
MKSWKMPRLIGVLALLLSAFGHLAGRTVAQTAAPSQKTRGSRAVDENGELQLAAARQNPLQLRQFLRKMPKGADLHYHLAGGIYAESFLQAGAEEGLCVSTQKQSLVVCPAPASGDAAGKGDPCDANWKHQDIVPARAVFCDQHLYDTLVDAFSMRGFVASAEVSGHDHFFAVFDKFFASYRPKVGEWVDEVARRAATQNEQYLELMETPDFSVAAKAANDIGWNEDFKQVRESLLASGLRENVQSAVAYLDGMEENRRGLEHCGQVDAAEACKVDVRFIYQVLRNLPKQDVFAQLLLGFEVASADPERVVGINMVRPEDWYVPMADYELHMRMVKYLHEVYPAVHITLHAGELAYGLVPPEGLCCHVRQAVEAGAERIGHGVSVMYEDRPHELLKEMAKRHVMVEINLTSNDLVLGVEGKNHPFPLYRQFGVPVALSTDDEGVSRIDLTNEYVRAVENYGLSYQDLKTMVRTGLAHAFLPGKSLWAKEDEFTVAAKECAKDALGNVTPSKSCAEFLKANEKAAGEWELERRFNEFEAAF